MEILAKKRLKGNRESLVFGRLVLSMQSVVGRMGVGPLSHT